MLIVNCSIIKPTCFRLNVKAESWVTFKSTDVTMTTAHLHIVGALHFRKTQDLTYQWVFFFFFLSECVEPPPCVEAMEPMEPSEVVSGPQRLSQALNTRNNYDFWKLFFFLFLSFPTDWDRFVCKRSAWIPSQTSVVSCSMDTSRLHWGLQEAEIFHSSLLDAGFCCPICISYASTKLPKLESVC